jgi:hypothetical protein
MKKTLNAQPIDEKEAIRIAQANKYLNIAIFLTNYYNMHNEYNTLVQAYHSRHLTQTQLNPKNIAENSKYLLGLLRDILRLEESEIFSKFLDKLPSLNILLSSEYIRQFEIYYKYEFLEKYFERLGASLGNITREIASKCCNLTIALPEGSPDNSTNSIITKDRVLNLITYYVMSNESSQIILDIFKHLYISKKDMVKLFLEAKAEDRLIAIGMEDDDIGKYLSDDEQFLIDNKLYKVLVLFDQGHLITVFNKEANKKQDEGKEPENKEDKEDYLVYDDLCYLISLGTNVEAYCNVVTRVHSTFWDMEKLPKFYRALNDVLKNASKPSTSEGSALEMAPTTSAPAHSKQSNDSWIAHIQNPILFCIKLVLFFKNMKEQLNFKEKDINDLSKSLLAFCIAYCKSAHEDVLMVNLFDQDSMGNEFLEYAFEIQEMSILDIEFIEGLIYQMWDLGRHTMQTVNQFMRINFMKDEIQKFNMGVFRKKFDMPIEEGDTFAMDYRFTSNSVFLRVLSEILWPISLIIMEFIFSLDLMTLYKEVAFTKNWLSTYFNRYTVFAIIHLYLRANYIVSNIIKSIMLKKFRRKGFYHSEIFTILNILYIAQLIVYPLFFWEEFMFLNVVQMLIVLTMCYYVYYNGLSINDIGVILRIFARMVYVVLIFGIVSIFIMILIAYPIHTIYIDFSQYVDGQLFPQMNVFYSLYNGVLTLFEFVFGAVIFVRPYLYQDVYTVSISFIMIIFSFFGNIMLANMLVAFLAKQFDTITKQAKYFTQRMQFGLVKTYNMENLDSMYTMPYPFTIIMLPFYLCLIPNSELRHKMNLFLRKIIHVINCFIPTYIFMNIYLLILMVLRYCEILLFIIIQIPSEPIHFLYMFAWLIGGPFLLLKLFLQDNLTMMIIMLNFSNEGDNLNNTSLNENAKRKVIDLFSKINKYAHKHCSSGNVKDLASGEGESGALISRPHEDHKNEVTVHKFLEILGIPDIDAAQRKAQFNGENNPDNQDENQEEVEEEDDEVGGSSFAEKFNSTYSQDDTKLAPLLLKKFIERGAKSNSTEEQILDLEFMIKKMKGNINNENIEKLIGFDKRTLEKASLLINDVDRDMDVKEEVGKIKGKVEDMDKWLTEVISDIDTIKALVKKRL